MKSVRIPPRSLLAFIATAAPAVLAADPNAKTAALEGSAPSAATESLGKSLSQTDAKLLREVNERLSGDEQLQLSGVDVSVSHNVVTFRGHFEDAEQASRAVRLARSIDGVLAVDNLAELPDPRRADHQVLVEVQKALRSDPGTRGLGVQASVQGGVVTLRGNVASWQAKELVASVVQRTRGVQRVQNDLRIAAIENHRGGTVNNAEPTELRR